MNALKILFVVIMGINFLIAQEKYPSRNSKEWNELSVAERWQAVNIPEDRLKKMSTNELIEHCINFDFMWDIFNYPDYSTGLNIIIENHNGVRELLNRKEAGKLIFYYYRKIDPTKITEISEVAGRGEFAGKIFFLELFLIHPNIVNQFKSNEKELIKTILSSHDICLDINARTGKDFYSGYSIGTKVLAMGRFLAKFEGRKAGDPALDKLDLSKLSHEYYRSIIDQARKI